MTTLQLSDAQRDYLNQLIPQLEKACHSKNTFNPAGANQVFNAIKTVQNINKEPLAPLDVLSIFYQAINIGQNAGAYTLQDVGAYYPHFQLLEKDIKTLEAQRILPKDKNEKVENEKVESEEKFQELSEAEATKLQKIQELQNQLNELKA